MSASRARETVILLIVAVVCALLGGAYGGPLVLRGGRSGAIKLAVATVPLSIALVAVARLIWMGIEALAGKHGGAAPRTRWLVRTEMGVLAIIVAAGVSESLSATRARAWIEVAGYFASLRLLWVLVTELRWRWNDRGREGDRG